VGIKLGKGLRFRAARHSEQGTEGVEWGAMRETG
jgi:hypothetical protein